MVDDLAGDGVLEKAVDSEIAALGIFAGRGEGDEFGAAAIAVGAIGAEGGDFDVVTMVFDDDDAEVGADLIAFGKEGEDLGGGGGGGDVVVFWFAIHESITHAAASEEGGVVGIDETLG